MSEKKFKPGQQVKHITGGPMMVVVKEHKDRMITCRWWAAAPGGDPFARNGMFESFSFSPVELREVEGEIKAESIA